MSTVPQGSFGQNNEAALPPKKGNNGKLDQGSELDLTSFDDTKAKLDHTQTQAISKSADLDTTGEFVPDLDATGEFDNTASKHSAGLNETEKRLAMQALVGTNANTRSIMISTKLGTQTAVTAHIIEGKERKRFEQLKTLTNENSATVFLSEAFLYETYNILYATLKALSQFKEDSQSSSTGNAELDELLDFYKQNKGLAFKFQFNKLLPWAHKNFISLYQSAAPNATTEKHDAFDQIKLKDAIPSFGEDIIADDPYMSLAEQVATVEKNYEDIFTTIQVQINGEEKTFLEAKTYDLAAYRDQHIITRDFPREFLTKIESESGKTRGIKGADQIFVSADTLTRDNPRAARYLNALERAFKKDEEGFEADASSEMKELISVYTNSEPKGIMFDQLIDFNSFIDSYPETKKDERLSESDTHQLEYLFCTNYQRLMKFASNYDTKDKADNFYSSRLTPKLIARVAKDSFLQAIVKDVVEERGLELADLDADVEVAHYAQTALYNEEHKTKAHAPTQTFNELRELIADEKALKEKNERREIVYKKANRRTLLKMGLASTLAAAGLSLGARSANNNAEHAMMSRTVTDEELGELINFANIDAAETGIHPAEQERISMIVGDAINALVFGNDRNNEVKAGKPKDIFEIFEDIDLQAMHEHMRSVIASDTKRSPEEIARRLKLFEEQDRFAPEKVQLVGEEAEFYKRVKNIYENNFREDDGRAKVLVIDFDRLREDIVNGDQQYADQVFASMDFDTELAKTSFIKGLELQEKARNARSDVVAIMGFSPRSGGGISDFAANARIAIDKQGTRLRDVVAPKPLLLVDEKSKAFAYETNLGNLVGSTRNLGRDIGIEIAQLGSIGANANRLLSDGSQTIYSKEKLDAALEKELHDFHNDPKAVERYRQISELSTKTNNKVFKIWGSEKRLRMNAENARRYLEKEKAKNVKPVSTDSITLSAK